ncbi:MAG: hypothetical protein ABR867_06625 [Nitrososphaerales archaeon]
MSQKDEDVTIEVLLEDTMVKLRELESHLVAYQNMVRGVLSED